jgi:hypothetical protein
VPHGNLVRDASARLAFEMFHVSAASYGSICQAIAAKFDLTAYGPLTVGSEVSMQDYQRDGQVVSLEWDIWSGFIVIAKECVSEPLVREIAAWLRQQPFDGRLLGESN